jgi:hypothetical protein
MFRNAMLSVTAILAVVTISTSVNAQPTWGQRYPWLHFSSNQKLRLPMNRNVSRCPGMKNYVVNGAGQCTDMGPVRVQ